MDDREHESEERGLALQRVLTDTGDRTTALIGAGVGAALLLTLVIVAITAGGDAASWVYVLLAVAALVVLYLTYRRMRVWAGWGNPELFLPSSDDLRLGDHVVVRFRRTARHGADPAGLTATATLVAEEVTRQADPGTRNPVEHVTVVHDEPLEIMSTDVVNQRVEVDIALDVPLSAAPPTMDLTSNSVRWRLVVRIEAPNAPDDDSTFPLIVAPEVAARLQSGGTGR